MKGYQGMPKRWVEGLYAGSWRPGEQGVEIRNPFFRRFLGRDNLRVPNVGFQFDQGRRTARPLMVGTDLLEGVLDSSGNPVPGASDGLFYTSLPVEQEPTLAAIGLLIARIQERELLTLLPADQHENPACFDPNTLTSTILDPDLTRLSPREQDLVSKRYSQWIGRRLPLAIWREIFMNPADPDSAGKLIGKEARNFLPHCTEYIVEYIPAVRNLLAAQKQQIDSALQRGELVPMAHCFPVAKDGLTVDLPDNERGVGGNKFDALLAAAFSGDYFQGDEHRGHKRAVVFGACSEYSVRLAIEHLFDADIQVIWMMTCTKGFDLFASKLYEAHYLMERYGKKLICTYDWIEALLGPKPAGWDAIQARVMSADQAQHAQWFAVYSQQLAQGLTSMGQPIVSSAVEAAAAARLV
ncbi:MAG: hypothetical protein ACAI44_38565 [Candidatus Sericytochromatia bacterium]